MKRIQLATGESDSGYGAQLTFQFIILFDAFSFKNYKFFITFLVFISFFYVM